MESAKRATTPVASSFAFISQAESVRLGRFATLGDVVDHDNGFLRLGLSDSEKKDLIQFLLGL